MQREIVFVVNVPIIQGVVLRRVRIQPIADIWGLVLASPLNHVAVLAVVHVSAKLLANQALTKMKVGKLPAKHARLEKFNHWQEKIIVKQTVVF